MIRRFSTKRGRPKTVRPTIDRGTPELIKKRMHHETIEAIDLCLDRMIISPAEHWCGIHLRWLHTLRFGAPSIQAINLDGIHDGSGKQDDCLWNEEREAEYKNAITTLHQKRLSFPLIDICIYNKKPDFLINAHLRSYETLKSIDLFRLGLQQLELLWRKNN
ncbi:MAG: hypothetical protein LW823_02180 [Rickettsiales bacterium]|jgi:hypothetical protein|nr:hypothetical protein [Rickettsiales bacterium]